MESIEFAGNAVHVHEALGDVTLRPIDNSTMEQLIVLNNQGELHNKELERFIIIDSNKVISGETPSSKWEIGNIHSLFKI